MKVLKLRQLAIFVAIITLVSSIVGAAIPFSKAYAATPTAQQWDSCYQFSLKNPSFTQARLSTADQTLVNQCMSYTEPTGQLICTKSRPDSVGNTSFVCTNPNNSTAAQEASKEAAAQRVQPVIEAACGPKPTTASEAAQQAYISCADSVRSAYDACYMTGGSATSSTVGTPEQIGRCVSQRLGGKINVKDATDAVSKGLGAGDQVIQDQIKRQQLERERANCTPDKGVWNTQTNVCDPKAPTTSTCNISEGVGWIVCPVSRFMAGIIDGAYAMISVMLEVPKLNTVSPATKDGNIDNGLLYAWGIMRNIANVIFVIAFLIIIYSQITNVGISNYGIKKMLPKLVVAAILINVSYWICALAVDASNLLGTSLYTLFRNLYDQTLKAPGWLEVIGAILGGTTMTVAGVAIAAAAGVGSSGLLWMAVPAVLGAIIAVIIAAIILALRQGVILLLVVVSPLAFAAYLLPNTQSLFDKWRKLFTALLIFYPLFAVLFGASQLAGSILIGAAKGNPNGAILVMIGMLVQVIPLFASISLLKFSGGFLASVADRLQGKAGALTNPINKYAERKRGIAKEDFQQRNLQKLKDVPRRAKGIRGVGYGLKRGALSIMAGKGERSDAMKLDELKNKNENEWSEYVASGADKELRNTYLRTRAQKDRKNSAERVMDEQYYQDIKSNLSGMNNLSTAAGIDPRGESRISAISTQREHKAFDESVGAEKTTMTALNTTDLSRIMRDSSESAERRAAAAGTLASRGGQADVNQAINDLGSMQSAAKTAEEKEVVSSIQKQFASEVGSKMPQSITGKSKGALSTGEFTGNLEKEIVDSLDAGRYSGKSLATMHARELEKIASTLSAATAAGTLTSSQLAQLGKLKASISEYKTAAATQGDSISDEYGRQLDSIERL